MTIQVIGDKSEGRRRFNKDLAAEINKKYELNEINRKKGKNLEPLNNGNRFEYVPSLGLYVSLEIEMFESNWNECQEKLHSRGDRMITPREFCEFILHIRDKKDKNPNESKFIEYVEGRDYSANGEWLDMKFNKIKHGWKIEENHFDFDGSILPWKNNIGERLTSCAPKVNFEKWLENNLYGIPRAGYDNGNLKYGEPKNGNVARYYGYELRCDINPSNGFPLIGARAVRHPLNMEAKK